MANGTIDLSSNKAWAGIIRWSSTPDTAGNYSILSVYAGMWKTENPPVLTSSNSKTSGTITINGQSYALIGINEFKNEVCIFEKDDIRIDHNSNGAKSVSISLTCSGQANTSLSGHSLSGSGTAVLDTIPRSASLSISEGTLGTQQTLSIVSESDSLTYTLKYTCGTKTGTICTKSSSKSQKWTPPASLASENTTGMSVLVSFELTAYAGETVISTSTAEVYYSIPATDPTISAVFSDAAGYKNTYGSYMQNLSKVRTVVTATPSYSATIVSYRITIGNETFTEADSISSAVTESGKVPVYISVTDSRNLTGYAEYELDFSPYSLPEVSQLSVHRCNQNGTENDQGEYVKVTYVAGADSRISGNNVRYKLEYKKTSASSYTSVSLSSHNDKFSVSGEYIFKADSGSSYNVRFTVTDDFYSTVKNTTASTAATIMHFKADGRGIGLGKIAEIVDGVDVGWNVYMNGNKVTDLADPEEDSDAVTLGYLNDSLEDCLGVVLKEGQYGSLEDRPAPGTPGRIYFQRISS